MSNFKILTAYQHLQSGVMFDELIDLGFVVINYCKEDKTLFWNTAFTDKNLNKEQLQIIELKFKSLERRPAIYFEDRQDLRLLGKFLEGNNFRQSFAENWMFHNGENIDISRFSQVKKVVTHQDLNVFLKTFNDCYKADDPQNPYGPISSGYMRSTEEVWSKHNRTDRLEYFIGYDEDKPVAVAALNNYQDYGYISNVGSLQNVRGKGFGKLITLFCVQASKNRGHNYHFLITEESSYPNEFYKKIEFKVKFKGVCYSKKDL